MSLAQFVRKFKNPYNYNIGFVYSSPDKLIDKKDLGDVMWLKHNYTDRFFADPFILDVTDSVITVLVEELIFGQRGVISELIVDTKTMTLIGRQTLLELNTHLSYPFIFSVDGKTYVMPENSQAGEIKVYEYYNHSLSIKGVAVEEGVNDATIINVNERFYMLATKILPDCNKDVYLYEADNPLGIWRQVEQNPVVTNKHFSRPGGSFFTVGNRIFRVAQDCEGLYGNSIHIREISKFIPYTEEEYCHIKPKSYRYSKGLHTLNFHKSGLAVIDGNGYFYPTLGRIFSPVFKIINFLRHK